MCGSLVAGGTCPVNLPVECVVVWGGFNLPYSFVGRMCGSLGADLTYPIHLSVECVVVWGRI